MRRIVYMIPLFILATGFSAFADQPASPKAGATHSIQILRAGKGEPRVRDAAAARTAAPRTPDPAEGTGRTRPYQAAKPGEGEPKG